MTGLQYAVVKKNKDAISAKIVTRTATDKRGENALNKQSPTASEIRIRVGTFGDEPVSRQILDKIKNRL